MNEFLNNLKFFLVGPYPNGELGGLAINLILSLATMVSGFVLGLLLALGRISGNRLLKDTGNQILLGNLFGYRASKRFKDEILGFSGIQNVILCIGANDILHPHTFACYPWEQEPSFKELTATLEEMICLSHSEGIKVIGTTITPLKCADGFSEKKRLLRKEVNAWMKAFTGYDAVFDLSSVIQSPEDSDMMNKVYNSGDFLHFNAEGGQAIADAFPREYLKP